MKAETDQGNVLVPASEEVRVCCDEDGNVVTTRSLADWERMEGGRLAPEIVVPRLYVPALIKHLRQLIAPQNKQAGHVAPSSQPGGFD